MVMLVSIHFAVFVTFARKMTLIDLVNHGYCTAACLHHIWNDICVANDSGVHFYFCCSVEASSPLKVLTFFVELYNAYGKKVYLWL